MPRRELAQNAGLAALSLVAVLGALELALRRFVEFPSQQPLAVVDVDWDHPVRFLPGSRHTYRSAEFTFHVAMNRFGRRDDEWSAEVVADPRSLLVIGDSFVLGNGVEAPDTIPSRLEARLAETGDRREVMNFGMPGGAPPQYRLLLEDALREGFAARTVVVGIFLGNDFYPDVLQPFRRAEPAAGPSPASPPAPPCSSTCACASRGRRARWGSC